MVRLSHAMQQLTQHNINRLFEQRRKSSKLTIRSEFFPAYEIEKIIIETKQSRRQVFKITQNGNISFFVIDFGKKIGEGGFGRVYEGYCISNDEPIVAKYGNITRNEIIALQKTRQYIAHSNDCVLMHRARGTDYERILQDKSISDSRKIELHAKILSKITELKERYNIYHGDARPRHIFIENGVITFIDFGLSEHEQFNNFTKYDIHKFNRTTKEIAINHCGKEFIQYIDSLSDVKYWREKRSTLLGLAVFSFICFSAL